MNWRHDASQGKLDVSASCSGRKIAGGAFPDQDDIEGLVTARAAVARATSLGIRVPLVEAVAAICARDLDPREGLMRVLESNLDLDGAFGGR